MPPLGDARADKRARRKAEFERIAREEALRRVAAARQRREAQARQTAEDEARARAEEAAARKAEEARAVEERRAAEARQTAEDEARSRARAEEAARAAAEEAARQTEDACRPPDAPPTEDTAPPPLDPPPIEDAWARLPEITVDAAHLRRNRIVTGDRQDPAHAAFDVLRTRLVQALHDNGWKRVAITSPGKDCGKTFTAANLAISLSRQENCRTLLMDLDMRRPTLHRVLGIDAPGSVGDMLRGRTAPGDHLRRMGRNPVDAGRNIAFALNDTSEAYASELLQDPRTEAALNRIEEEFAPDVMLFDLPPALFYDDVIAFRPLFDGVLLVIGGGLTTQKEIAEVERRLGEGTPLLGLVLNKAEGTDLDRYSY